MEAVEDWWFGEASGERGVGNAERILGSQKHPVGNPSESPQQPSCHLGVKAASTRYPEVTLVPSLKEGRIVENISRHHRTQERRKFRA